ncbi:1-deoxy-D-xylulose-5-phosphate synthase, partial [bacterium]|nr:1-deoxy-D-xylulose-5-phosphate synthase [bacterium]
MHRILPKIESPEDLKLLDHQELEILCQEMRDELVRVLSLRPAHFASNLGVVELCVALHLSYDFSKDRIIWDTGHQIYPHKLITGRYRNFDTIRTKGGLMGYPNPAESEFDLFMTGHAGCSLSTALGLKVGDDLNGNSERHSIAVIGDGALPSGIFEEFGFRYFGPIDGHDLPGMLKWFEDIKQQKGPILLHVLTKKGCGVPQASEDPVTFHTPPVFEKIGPERNIISMKRGGSRGYTDAVSSGIFKSMQENKKVCVITAAMCQGNKLEKIREEFPDRFFDVGICESHAVAFAAGLAKTGNRPIVDIYSTFLQRSFDQVFQEVALQNLPVLFTLDRAGLTGPDGPTHHGAFDNTYMRVFPNMTVMAPGDELDVEPMIQLCLAHNGPTVIRYPKANLEHIERDFVPLEIGQSEVLDWGEDIILIAYGTLLGECCKAAEILRDEGHQVGVINARFLKPMDKSTLFKALEESNLIITVEEGS